MMRRNVLTKGSVEGMARSIKALRSGGGKDMHWRKN